MNPKPVIHFLRSCLALCSLFVLSAAPGFAQAVSIPGQVKKTDPVQEEQNLAVYRAGVSNAKAFAKANNLPAAEQALIQLNKSKPNTAGFEMETAQRIVHLADQLAREGQPASVPALATRALQYLTQADPLAKDARTRAAAKSLAGFVYERYLANPTAALASYRAAVQLSPATAIDARESADRLQRTDDNLKARSGGR